METTCTFCQISSGQRESEVVLEDELSLAFLDQRPLFFGHCLLIPRAHYETLPDLPASLVAPLFANAQLLSRAVQQAMGAEGILVLINNRVSQSVPHLHVHIVPRRHGDGLRSFLWPRTHYSDRAQMAQVGAQIRRALADLRSAGPSANAREAMKGAQP